MPVVFVVAADPELESIVLVAAFRVPGWVGQRLAGAGVAHPGRRPS